jgi:hypothetical protein
LTHGHSPVRSESVSILPVPQQPGVEAVLLKEPLCVLIWLPLGAALYELLVRDEEDRKLPERIRLQHLVHRGGVNSLHVISAFSNEH